jgi:hypothetical protein
MGKLSKKLHEELLMALLQIEYWNGYIIVVIFTTSKTNSGI